MRLNILLFYIKKKYFHRKYTSPIVTAIEGVTTNMMTGVVIIKMKMNQMLIEIMKPLQTARVSLKLKISVNTNIGPNLGST